MTVLGLRTRVRARIVASSRRATRALLLIAGLGSGCHGTAASPGAETEGDGTAGTGFETAGGRGFQPGQTPQQVVDGFALTVSKPTAGTIMVAWADQGVTDYEVWTSDDPYFEPGDAGSSLVTTTTSLSYSTADGTEAYYRVVAAGAAVEWSTTVGQLTHDLYTGWTKLGLCLVSDVDTWDELWTDMPSQPGAAAMWDPATQAWVYIGTGDTFATGQSVSVEHVTAPSPNTYTSIGHVPTDEDISVTLLPGDNIVTMLPLRFGPMLTSELLAEVPAGIRVGTFDLATQTVQWHPEDGDWVLPTCSPIHLEVSAQSEWPPPAPGPEIPPDPSTVAPPLDTTVTTRFADSVAFLYTGADPIQTGVAAGTIEDHRASVIRGRVLDENGDALPGAEVTIVNHPEYGETLSRADGWYDLVVNGGGRMIVEHNVDGRIPVQRTTIAGWQEFSVVDDAVLIERDTASTVIEFTDPIEVAMGSSVTDADGTRQQAVLFRAGTVATMEVPGSAPQVLPSITVRATEQTVGTLGPERMPGPLPVASAYTYAVDYSIDEALAAGAERVTFSPPAIAYLDNFIGLPVGQVVPVGSYDMSRAAWVPEQNGLVVQVVSETAGLADIDLDGDGVADPAGYAAEGIDDDERTELANLYEPGDELWRVETEHFSSWDSNLGWSPPPDAVPPPEEGPPNPEPDPNPCDTPGSILECQGQVMGERLPIAGTPLSLNYRSDRVPGRTSAFSLTLPLTHATPPTLTGVTTRLVVAGRLIREDFAPADDEIYTVTWDGNDVYGRRLQGPTPAELCVGFDYDAFYSDIGFPIDSLFGYNGNGNLITTSGGRGAAQATFWRCYADAPVGGGAVPANAAEAPRALSWVGRYNLGTWDARAGSPALGGWTLDIHHTLAPEAGVLYRGDGTRRDGTETYNTVVQTVGGGGPTSGVDIPATDAAFTTPTDVAVGPDGSIYIADLARVVRIDPDGVLRAFAGTGVSGFAGDGGPATAAQLGTSLRIAIGPDESVYISDRAFRRVRRVDPTGVINTVAGNGSTGHSGDGDPAVMAGIGSPEDIVVGPDGTLYIAADSRIRRVSPGGEIATFAGGSCTGGLPDGKIATGDCFCDAEGIALGDDGSIYVTMNPLGCGGPQYVYRIGMDNRFQLVAGGGSPVDGIGDGLVGPSARLFQARDVEVSRDGIVYVSDFSGSGSFPGSGHRVRMIGHDNMVSTLAGDGFCDEVGDDGPAANACLRRPIGMAMGQDHALYVATGTSASPDHRRIRRVSSAGLGWSADGRVVASADHRELYVFSAEGRHEGTLDALTGTTMWTFGYDAEGRLVTATDRYGRDTTIQRNGSGEATAIVSPDGQTTTLTIPDGDYLQAIANPEGETHQFGYSAGGLLTSRITPRNDQYDYTYDSGGRLILATDPEGGSKSFEREELGPKDYEITMTTELGRESTYLVEYLPFGDQHRVNTQPDGTAIDVLVGTDGVTTVTYPDGTVAETQSVADPRFGMQSPVKASRTVTTPAGLQRVTTTSRAVTLDIEDDPLSMSALTETHTVNGRTWVWAWDGATDTVTQTSPEGRVVTSTLDANGVVDVVQAGALAPIDFDFDAAGRTESVTTGTGASSRLIDFTYGTDGFLDSILDPANRAHAYSHDLAGRLELRTRPDLEVVTYAYDDNGNLAGITPASAPEHGIGYDATDRMTSYDPPAVPGVVAPSTLYSLTDDHEIDLVTRADGLTIAFAYGVTSGRLDAITTPRGTYNLVYDAASRVDTLTDPDGGTLAYTYDGTLRTAETRSGSAPGTVGWSYDAEFRLAGETVNGGFAVSFNYDDDGVLVQVGAETLTPDPTDGTITSTTLDTIDTVVSYDEFAVPDRLTYSAGATVLYDQDVSPRDALGRVTAVDETIVGTSRTLDYGYDDIGRLETVTEDGVLVATYGYDANSNRTSLTTAAGTTSATYDDQDRLLTNGTVSYTYTDAGELATATDSATSDTTLYSYDVLGGLRSVELPDTTLIEYDIDARGRRVAKRVDGVLERGWLYRDGLSIVAELDAAGAVVSRFVYGLSPHVPDYMVQSGTTYRLVSDQLGSVRLVVDAATGVVAQRLDYDEWGGVLTDTNPGFQPFAFAGGHYDPDTGLLRFGARDYDPTVGRWTAKDPILFNGGGENLYQYADSDPVNLVDPTGNNPIAACLLNPNCVGGLTLLAAAWAAYVDACVRTGACDLKIPPFPSRPSRPSDWDASDQVCRATPLPRAQPIPMDPYRPRPSPWRCSRLRASNSTCMYICRNPVTQQSRFHREAPGPDGCPDQPANFDP